MFLVLCVCHANAQTNSSIEQTFSGVTSYLTVDLVERRPAEETYRRLPIPFPQDVTGTFVAAGQYLFRKDRVKNGDTPFPADKLLSLIATFDPNAKWPILRCPPNYVLALVLLDAKGMIKGVILIDTCRDTLIVENATGQGRSYRFGSGDEHVAPLIKLVVPDLKY